MNHLKVICRYSDTFKNFSMKPLRLRALFNITIIHNFKSILYNFKKYNTQL